jgi:hypothetical protein
MIFVGSGCDVQVTGREDQLCGGKGCLSWRPVREGVRTNLEHIYSVYSFQLFWKQLTSEFHVKTCLDPQWAYYSYPDPAFKVNADPDSGFVSIRHYPDGSRVSSNFPCLE